MLYYDSDRMDYVTTEQLKAEYKALKEDEATFAETFEEYLSNCMSYNGGTLDIAR